MHTSALTHPYKHHRFPAEIISYGVWFALSTYYLSA
jgi:hypothetical protein